MKTSPCPRKWEAEAVEDRRLDGADRASFERHAALCRECAREVAYLAKLRGLDRMLPAPPAGPLDRRRRRASLLRGANEKIVSRVPRPWAAVRVGWLGLAGAACAGALVISFFARSRAQFLPSKGPLFEITSVAEGRWSVLHGGSDTEVELIAGKVELHVEKLDDSQRFVLGLPDGKLEVRGTRFSVEASPAHTRRVAVSEGMVALRIAGQAERSLAAGESWESGGDDEAMNRLSAPMPSEAPPSGAPATSAALSASAGPPADVPSLLAEAKSRARHQARRGAPHRSVAPTPAGFASAPAGGADLDSALAAGGASSGASEGSKESPVPAAGTAGALFGEAMQAFDSGSYSTADARFARFERDFGGDARSEDAAFLRVVCALRRGDRAATIERAQAYLSTYPKGLRRQEVERLRR